MQWPNYVMEYFFTKKTFGQYVNGNYKGTVLNMLHIAKCAKKYVDFFAHDTNMITTSCFYSNQLFHLS